MLDPRIKDILDKVKPAIDKAKEQLKKLKGIKLKDIDIRKLDPRKIDFRKLDPRKIDFRKIDRTKIKKNFIWIFLGIVVFTFIMARTSSMIKNVFFGKKAEEKKMVEFAESIPVKVYKVKRMDFKDTLPVMGRIEGFKEIELMFDGKGILESFNFEEGERILEGDIIASLDQKDALLKLKYASLEMEKAQKLYDLGGVDKLAVDQKKLEYESAKRDLEKTNIYAPSDGYLGSKEKDTGAFVNTQDKIGTFVDFSEVYAVFDIIEEDSSKMELGQTVEIFLDAYPGESYNGTVDMISPMIEGRTRTQTIKVELENEEGLLKPGMFARAVVNTYEKKDALIIPASSFKKKENKFFVYVVHPEGEAEGEGEVEGEGVAAAPDDEEASGEKEEEKPASEQPSGMTPPGANPEGSMPSEIGAEAGSEEGAEQIGIVEEREIKIAYSTYDVSEVESGLEEGEMIIRELHQDYKDQDRVEITEVQETIF